MLDRMPFIKRKQEFNTNALLSFLSMLEEDNFLTLLQLVGNLVKKSQELTFISYLMQ
jgi:hypothetical protein